MAAVHEELIYAAIHYRVEELTGHNVQNDREKQYEFIKQTILADKSLTKDEKSYATKLINKKIDKYKIRENKGTRRICENCQEECLATLYCEYCVRNYLKENFSTWTSGNDNIDNLIRECQMKTLKPDNIVEWVPYNNLDDIKYLTKTDYSEIYTAIWIDGYYDEWDFKEKKLKRVGRKSNVILKKLRNVEKTSEKWFDEAKSHLIISSKYGEILTCYGLTKDPLDENYILVMNKSHMNLGEYLQQNHNNLTWKERIQIADDIIYALSRIHKEKSIHKNLHPGNIIFNQTSQLFYVNDLGFCGPANRPLESVYGSLPYIAPEIIAGKEITFASDIYSIGILMWEISSGQPPFTNYENEYDLAMNIVNGMRPKITSMVSGVPLEYKKLMMQCWDADPMKRPDLSDLYNKLLELKKYYYQNISDESNYYTNKDKNMIKKFIKKFKFFKSRINDSFIEISKTDNFDTNYKLFTSKVYIFENFPEPKNATEEEQEVFQSKPYISNNNKCNEIDNNIKIFKIQIPQLNSNKDEDELYNNPNLHSEEQDELEIPWTI